MPGRSELDGYRQSPLSDGRAFEATLRRLGSQPRAGLLEELTRRYSEPHRAYHTLQHLAEAFDTLAACGDRVERWDEVLFALWFHDAIYDTRRHDNEERSADWARDELLAGGAPADA